MTAQQITISVPGELARYLAAAPDPSFLIAEALRLYRERSLARELAEAYQEDAAETRRLHQEWSAADADLPT